jgi:hypothetical protein
MTPGPVGGSVSNTGVIAGPNDADYFEVQFNITAPATQNINYHPKITLTNSATEVGIVFDVTSDCSTGISCTNGSSAGLTQTWEQAYGNPNLDLPINLTWTQSGTPANGTVYVKVYRSPTSAVPTSCAQDTYTITASN